ncbi:MAG: DUF4127 family protein [Candidatus Eremiobacteraeota bacterium]|nr:DUF4127 family protein [Candidatus Eremiobacteraeota bacterium]
MIAMLFALVAPVVLVPLDDRPVTRQLPAMLGEIAGRPVREPPREMLGNYLTFGKPDAIISWLNGPAQSGASAYVVSTDMLAYGGLVASRIPQTPYVDAYFRLRSLRQLRRAQPHAWMAAFGTVMRLAPTGVPAIGGGVDFFAAYPGWKYLQEYANLHDPPLPSEAARAAALEKLIGPDLLQGYLSARDRNYGVDLLVLQATAAKTVDRAALGQDDAGPIGLHVKEVQRLQTEASELNLGDRISIEPGADELGMALVANALAREANWTPKVRVLYSTPDGAAYQDKLEFAPISTAIDRLVALCGGTESAAGADVTLYVRVPGTTAAQDDAFEETMRDDAVTHSVAFADLAFLTNDYASQAAFAKRLLGDGTMGRIDAYASWNTNANTVGTALAEAVATGAGRRTHTYNALAHRDFTFNRVLDDVIFHTEVRPDLNRTLDAQGVTDHTYLLPDVATPLAERNRALVWGRAQDVLAAMYPNDHIAAISVTLPWNRTFETEIDARLAPNL